MSSLARDSWGRSKYWICCYTAADGRQLKRSTKETDKRKATAICREWEALESLGKSGLLATEEQFRRVFVQAFERITGHKLEDLSVREWLQRWLDAERGAVAEASFAKYAGIVRAFLAFLSTRAELRLEAITTEDFLRYRDHLLTEGLAPRTVNTAIRRILSRAFAAAAREGLVQRNPIAGIRPLRDVRVEKGVFSPEQITKLLAEADPDWRGLILAGYYSGARLGDLARLTWQSVDLAERSITFTQKKTDAKIKVPIHSELLDYLLSRSVPDDGSAPLFPSLYGLRGSGKSGLSSSFRRLMARARINQGVARARTGQAGRNVTRLSFHSLRHSFTSALANAGVPAELRQKLTGHFDAKSHAMYSHHEFGVIAEALERIARLPKE